MFPFLRFLKWNDVVKPCIHPDHRTFDDIDSPHLSAVNRGRSNGARRQATRDFWVTAKASLLCQKTLYVFNR